MYSTFKFLFFIFYDTVEITELFGRFPVVSPSKCQPVFWFASGIDRLSDQILIIIPVRFSLSVVRQTLSDRLHKQYHINTEWSECTEAGAALAVEPLVHVDNRAVVHILACILRVLMKDAIRRHALGCLILSPALTDQTTLHCSYCSCAYCSLCDVYCWGRAQMTLEPTLLSDFTKEDVMTD